MARFAASSVHFVVGLSRQPPSGREELMTSLITEPQIVASAAADVANINSAISAAKAAAAAPTTGVLAAAADEVSAATAALFGNYANQYHSLLSQASAFHQEFVQALSSAGSTYAAAEAANANSIAGALEGLIAPLAPIFGPTPTPFVPGTPVPQPPLTPTTFGFAMGGSGLPVPPPSYVSAVLNWVNFHGSPVTLANTQGLFTPEGLYPLTGIKDLTLAVSVDRGVQILDNTIQQQLLANPTGSTSILGYSQSAVISSLEMQALASPGYTGTVPTATQLGFTLLGDPMNANGGVLERFAPLTLPSLGLDFYGATPSNTIYPTNIYTLQYDGYADFPRYPINFLADLNAFIGIETVHGTYPSIDPAHLPAGDSIVSLPTSPGYSGVTNYYEIVTPGLPLLDPLRVLPVIGNPLADLLQPDLQMIVNLGYGDPNFGYSTAPADVPTPFGLFPHYNQITLAQDLIGGAGQGITAFNADIHAELPAASTLSLSSISHSLTSMAAGTGGASIVPAGLAAALSSPDSFIGALQTANTNITNAITNVAADSYAVLLPTADIANALLTTIPSYDLNLFLSGIQQALGGNILGGLQYALVAPLAADTALFTLAGGFEAVVVIGGVEDVIGDISGLV
jgi:hypothetical protein